MLGEILYSTSRLNVTEVLAFCEGQRPQWEADRIRVDIVENDPEIGLYRDQDMALIVCHTTPELRIIDLSELADSIGQPLEETERMGIRTVIICDMKTYALFYAFANPLPNRIPVSLFTMASLMPMKQARFSTDSLWQNHGTATPAEYVPTQHGDSYARAWSECIASNMVAEHTDEPRVSGKSSRFPAISTDEPVQRRCRKHSLP